MQNYIPLSTLRASWTVTLREMIKEEIIRAKRIKQSVSIADYVSIFFVLYCIVQPSIFYIFLNFDGAGRIYMLMLAVIILLYLGNRTFFRTLFKSPVGWWTLWATYMSVNSIVQGVGVYNLSEFVFIFNYILLPLSALWVSVYQCNKSPRTFIKLVHYAFLVYCIIGILTSGLSVSKDARGGQLLGNAMALNGVCLLAIASIRYVSDWSSSKMFISSVTIAVAATFICATRKAFGAELLILGCVLLLKIDMKKASNVLLILLILSISYFAFDYIVNETVIGARFSNIENDSKIYNTTDSKFLSFLGDRAYFYINGWAIFLKHPFFGIGLMNFPVYMHIHLPIHSEYIVEICEGGILGSIIFLSYNISIIKKINKLYRIRKREAMMFYSCMATIWFISFTAWTYQFPFYFIVMGSMIGICNYYLSKV